MSQTTEHLQAVKEEDDGAEGAEEAERAQGAERDEGTHRLDDEGSGVESGQSRKSEGSGFEEAEPISPLGMGDEWSLLGAEGFKGLRLRVENSEAANLGVLSRSPKP